MTNASILAACFSSALFAAACGSSSSPMPDAKTTDAAATVDAIPGAAPVVTKVAWAQAPGCVAGTAHMVTVTITATDADTAAAMLTFTGSVSSCTPVITGNPQTIMCPELAPYAGSVTAHDPEGHASVPATGWTIMPCADGSKTF